MNAAITLKSNLFCYHWYETILRLGGNNVKHIRRLGVVMDTFVIMQNNVFRYQNRKLCKELPN